MRELKFQNITKPELVAIKVAAKIIFELEAGKRVLWLISGGSAITVAVEAAKLIIRHSYDLLTITLTDERYGETNHSDSNWLKLQQAGFYLPEAQLIPVLIGQDKLTTTQIFNLRLAKELSQADYVVGLFGIGSDGHTAGILPNSPAVSALDLVCLYLAPDFERITITPSAIAHFNEIMVYAVSELKWPTLANLKTRINISAQPAQALKQVSKLTIFTDYKV